MVLCLMLFNESCFTHVHVYMPYFSNYFPTADHSQMELWGWMMVGRGTLAPCKHLWYAKICSWQSCFVDNFVLQESGCLDKEEVPCSARVKPLVLPLLSIVWLPLHCRDLPQGSWALSDAGTAGSASQAPGAPYRVIFPKPHPHTKSTDITCSSLLHPAIPQNSATCQAQVRLTLGFSTPLELQEHHSDGQSKLVSPCHVCLPGNGMFMFIPIDPDGWHFCSI